MVDEAPEHCRENAGGLAPTIRIEPYRGARADLRSLFELAEDSPLQLHSYLDSGRVLVAVCAGRVVGHLQITGLDQPAAAEIKNMAVLPSHRRRGIGRALAATAIELARSESRCTLVVATAAADVDNLRFYQRLGFRMRSIERDAFTVATGYGADPSIDGIQLRDRVWLDLELDVPASDDKGRAQCALSALLWVCVMLPGAARVATSSLRVRTPTFAKIDLR
jgi:GNAT superfamily N-acetyltransferase